MASRGRWLAAPLLLLTFAAGADMTKFKWDAGSSAPYNIPMRYVAANFYLHGGDAQYVPTSASTANGWGTPDGSHPSDSKKPLPEKLDILFFSYLENQFYRGTFELPYEKILKLFQTSYYSPKARKDVTADEIVVGVAPGGVVAVWARGYDRQVEVFYGKAKKVDLPWSTLTDATHISREEYIDDTIKYYLNTPEALANFKKNGPPLGLWDRYRTRYTWQPVFINMPLQDTYIRVISYFNGESQYLNYPLDKADATASRPVPKYMRFIWSTPKASADRLIELFFNEKEVFDVFHKLGANGQPLQLELKIEAVNGNPMFTVSLRNDKEKIEFDHTEVKNYGAAR
jgi:hypothetical protein